MKRLRFVLLALLVVTFFSGCNKRPADLPSYPKYQTTLIYFAGTSLRSDFANNLDCVEVAIERGALGNHGEIYYLLPSISGKAQLCQLVLSGSRCESRVVREYDDFASLGDGSMSQVLNDFKAWTNSNSETTRSYNLIVSGHGTGWVKSDHPYLRSVSGDVSMWEQKVEGAPQTRFIGSTSDGFMNIEELKSEIDSAGMHFGYILFDQCLQSNIELLYRLRGCCDYVVASPCEILSYGFPYDKVLSGMFTESGKSFDLQQVCENFYDFYNSYHTKSGCIAMCVTSELDALAEVVSRMDRRELSSSEKRDLQRYEGLSQTVYYDLGDYINSAVSDSLLLAEFTAQFDRAFPAECRFHTNSFFTGYLGSMVKIDYYSGVSTSEPSVKFTDEWALEPWAIATTAK